MATKMKFTVKDFRKLQEDLFGNYIGQFNLTKDIEEVQQILPMAQPLNIEEQNAETNII